MSQCCGKVPDIDDVHHIRDSIDDYFKNRDRPQADPEYIKEYWNQHTQNAEKSGSPSKGETKILNDGAVQNVSPYNPGDVFQAETFNPDGSIHYTTINSDKNTRHSHDVTPEGYIKGSHPTNQNLPSGDRDRHK